MQRLQYRLANLQGIGTRGRQEDSFAVANVFDTEKLREQGLFFAVCDGMGGMKDGALASQTAITSLRSSFFTMDRKRNMAVQLKESILAASAAVKAEIGGGGGSTAIACVIYDDQLYYAGVGDSYFYLLRNKSLYRLNLAQNLCHKNYMEEIQAGRINPSDFQDRTEANALTDFLGMEGDLAVDAFIRPLPLRANDVLLACSDGVGGVLLEEDIRTAMTLSEEQEICQQLEQRLVDYAMPHQDNYTALVVKCIS